MRFTMRMHAAVLALALASSAAWSGAAAAAMPLAGARMPAKSLTDLKLEIRRARAVDAATFVRVNQLVTRAPEADARARGRKAATALVLARLGPSALLPMLELLAVDPPRGVSDAEAPKVRRDVIEAVGLLKSPSALPVLTAILDDASEDAETTRTVAEAVARIGTDEAASRLLSALDASKGDRTRAIVAGMGDCRRLRVTEALAARLRAATDEGMARAAARSLGRAGNAWAWKTLAHRSEEAIIRRTAAAALVEAYVHQGGDARKAASNALMVVDAPETPALVAEARRGASADTQKALDALAARFARNPARD